MPKIKYRLKDGTPVSGVTTILGAILNKPALIGWAFNMGMENLELLSREIMRVAVKENAGLGDIIATVRGFQPHALYEKRDKAADAGTLGHAFVEHELKGLPEPDLTGIPKDIIEKAEGCLLAFLEWKDRTKFKLIHSEIELVSEVHKFGGCLDIGGGVTDLELIDLKTSKGIYSSMWFQVAAYGILWDEVHPDNPIKGYNILRVGPDGNFGHERRITLPDEKEVFLLVNSIHQILKRKGVKL
jgi:hypothetical protein